MPLLLSLFQRLQQALQLPQSLDDGDALRLAEAVGGMDEGDPRLHGRLVVQSRVTHIHRGAQPIPADHQPVLTTKREYFFSRAARASSSPG